jgi:hypothetical protein
VEENLIR